MVLKPGSGLYSHPRSKCLRMLLHNFLAAREPVVWIIIGMCSATRIWPLACFHLSWLIRSDLLLQNRCAKKGKTHHEPTIECVLGGQDVQMLKKAASPPRTPRSYWSRYLSGSTCKKIINSFWFFLSFSRPNRYIFLHCGRLNELNLIRASHLPVVNNADFPAVKKKKAAPGFFWNNVKKSVLTLSAQRSPRPYLA